MKAVSFRPTKISSPSLRLGKNVVGGTVYEEMEFSGFAGLNNKYSNVEIADNEASDLLNVEFDAVGAIVKRKGYALIKNFGTSQINSSMPFYTSSGTRKLILAYGTTLVQYDPATGIETTLTSGLTGNGQRVSGTIDTPHSKFYMVNGNASDGLMSWDGTTFTKAISGAPNGQYVLYYKNHLYMAGDPSAPYRLYMSDQGDPTSWPVNNYIDFPDGMGGITGIAQLGDSVVVMKEQGVFILKGSDPSNYVVVDTFASQNGAISHWSIVRIPNGLVYLARDGVWLFDGKKFDLISDKIQGSIDNWNQAYLNQAVAFDYDHKYWLSVPDGTGQATNNNTYVFSYLYGWWTKYNIPMQSACVFNAPSVTPYFTDTAGNLFQADDGDNDNGNAIDAYLTTKSYAFGAPAHYKTFKQVFMFALAQSGNYGLTVTFNEDFGLNTKSISMPLAYTQPTIFGKFIFGKAPFGGKGEIAHATTNVPGQARYLSFKIEGNGANAPFTFLGFVVRFKVKRRMT